MPAIQSGKEGAFPVLLTMIQGATKGYKKTLSTWWHAI